MHPDVKGRFGPFKVSSEGKIPYMYCDHNGWVTAAVGVLYATPEAAERAPWLSVATKQKASKSEIHDTFHACKEIYRSAGKKPQAKAYKDCNLVYMTDVALKAYVLKVLSNKDNYARIGFGAQWDTFPADAQMAILAVLWKYGTTTNLKANMPEFHSAIKDADFLRCAQTCDIEGDSAVRQWKNKAFRFMFVTADAVKKSWDEKYKNYDLEPNVVRWPTVWQFDEEERIGLEYDWMPNKAPGRESLSW